MSEFTNINKDKNSDDPKPTKGTIKSLWLPIYLIIFLIMDNIFAICNYNSFSINNDMSKTESYFQLLAIGFLIFLGLNFIIAIH